MKRVFQLIILLITAVPVLAAPSGVDGRTSLTGKVKDKATGETIPGAEVYFPDLRTGAVTDIDGNYAVSDLPATKALVKVSMVGYATITMTIDLSTVTKMDFELSESVTEMQDVVVTGTSKATELKRSPVPMAMASRTFLRENASSNAIETLGKIPGVSTVSTG
ncbi:MAG: carboxypeptidase-like regulatory domain-containing protein, partial [Flavobacteriales bacterium]